MTNDYSQMDKWTSEQVAEFKEEDRETEFYPSDVKGFEMALASAAMWCSIAKPVVAVGDSWFNYLPGTDIIDCLRKHHKYSIKNHAKAGDTLENMIYGTGINNDFQRVSPSIERVLRTIGKLKPKVFLFSGGGNDIAGDEFESYLNHKNSGLPILRKNFINIIIDNVFLKYFEDLIQKVTTLSPNTNIIVHGYGHTIPTGKGVNYFYVTFAGPWLRPALAKKGIFDVIEQRQAVKFMIDKYNEMLSKLDKRNPNFCHVDLRKIIDPDNDWVNELHLKNSAYARVAKKIHNVIDSL